MKNRVTICYISFLILVLSVAIVIVSHFYNWEIMNNLGYGIFGSSFVSLLIYFFEYFVEKRKNFELFYTKSIDILNVLSKIRYYDFDKRSEILLTYWLYKHQTADFSKTTSCKQLSARIKKETGYLLSPQELDIVSDNIAAKFKEAASTYIDFLSCDFMGLNLIIGDYKRLVPFLSKRQARTYRETYDYIMFLCKEINSRAMVIDSFVKDILLKDESKSLKDSYHSLNRIFFRKEAKNGSVDVYAAAKDELFDRLEKMRCSFYREKFVQPTPFPQYILKETLHSFQHVEE